jgi:hypothetical protein
MFVLTIKSHSFHFSIRAGPVLYTRQYQFAHMQVDCVWNVMAHAQKPDFVFWRNGRVHLNRRGRQFSRLIAAEVCASAVVMPGTPCSEVVWRILATHSILQFSFLFPSRASPCAITFQLDSTTRQRAGINADIQSMLFQLVRSVQYTLAQYSRSSAYIRSSHLEAVDTFSNKGVIVLVRVQTEPTLS